MNVDLQNSISLTHATWWLVIATFGLVFTGIGAIFFTWRQIKNERTWRVGENRWRQAENLARLRELFEGQIFSHLRSRLAIDRLAQIHRHVAVDYENAPAPTWRVLDFIETVCRELEEDRLSVEDVWSEFAEWVYLYWVDFGPVITEIRRVRADSSYYESMEAVVSKLDEFCEKKGIAKVRFTAKDVSDFYGVDSLNAPKNYKN